MLYSEYQSRKSLRLISVTLAAHEMNQKKHYGDSPQQRNAALVLFLNRDTTKVHRNASQAAAVSAKGVSLVSAPQGSLPPVPLTQPLWLAQVVGRLPKLGKLAES